MIATSSPARTTLSTVAYAWFTATSGLGGSRSAPGERVHRGEQRRQPSTRSRSSMSSDDAPSASAYEAKRRTRDGHVSLASYTSTDADGSAKGKPRALPGLKRFDVKRLRLGHLLGVVLELLDVEMPATIARSSFEGLNTGTGRAETSTGEPVRGLRAMRVLRWRILKVPKPRTSMFFCSWSASLIASRKAVDDAGAVLLRDHRPGRPGDLGGDTLDQIGFGHGWASDAGAREGVLNADRT